MRHCIHWFHWQMNGRKHQGCAFRPALLLTCLLTFSLCLTPLPAAAAASAAAPPANHNLELVGQIGGPALAVAVQGHYAYVGFSKSFAVIDIADPAHPRRLGALLIYASRVLVQGDYAYVGGKQGLQIVAIREPTHPAIVGSFATAPVIGLALSTNYIYVLDNAGGLSIIEISAPERAQRRGFLHPDRKRLEGAPDEILSFLKQDGKSGGL